MKLPYLHISHDSALLQRKLYGIRMSKIKPPFTHFCSGWKAVFAYFYFVEHFFAGRKIAVREHTSSSAG